MRCDASLCCWLRPCCRVAIRPRRIKIPLTAHLCPVPPSGIVARHSIVAGAAVTGAYALPTNPHALTPAGVARPGGVVLALVWKASVRRRHQGAPSWGRSARHRIVAMGPASNRVVSGLLKLVRRLKNSANRTIAARVFTVRKGPVLPNRSARRRVRLVQPEIAARPPVSEACASSVADPLSCSGFECLGNGSQ